MPPTVTPSVHTTSQQSGRPDRLSVDPEALFVYGTLLFPEVIRALIDRVPNRVPASAPGWRLAALPGRVYPGLVLSQGSVNGLLISDLTRDEWRTLDSFEDDSYELRQLSLTDGRAGWAYVCTESAKTCAHDWS